MKVMAKLEEAEKRRQAILKAEAEKAKSGANYLIQKKAEDTKADPAAEFKKTKEQLAEEKKVALQIRVKPLALEGLKVENLREMATDMWTQLVLLETEKYDFEERSKRQDYDLKELKDKQKQQLKAKALKFGLDPEALTGNHPPKVKLASKFERRVDTRSFDERKELFRGGWEEEYEKYLDSLFEEKQSRFDERTVLKLPRWFGERPGRKPGDPETPEPVEEEIPEIEFEDSEPEHEEGEEGGSK